MTVPDSKSHYSTLELTPSATDEDIRAAYRRLAKRYHPDTNPDDPKAEERFKQVAAAYKVLSDPKARLRYERATTIHPHRKRTAAETEIASDDVRIRLHLSLEEAARGGTRTVHYPKAITCPDCRGARINDQDRKCLACEGDGWQRKQVSADVTFPAGVRQGHRVTIPGAGHKKGPIALPGDLVVEVIFKEHRYFELIEADLQYKALLGLALFIEGGSLRIPTLVSPIEIAIQPHTPDGRVLRIPGRGLPAFEGEPAGDLLVRIELCLPKKLSSKERHMVEQLMKLPGFFPPADATGFVPRGD